MWRLLATGWQGWVTVQLAAGLQPFLELVLSHWWAEPGFGVGGCRVGIPGSSVSLLVDGVGS